MDSYSGGTQLELGLNVLQKKGLKLHLNGAKEPENSVSGS